MSEPYLRLAGLEELVEVTGIIDMAKTHLKAQGIDQWQQGYPDLKILKEDLKARRGYFICLDNKVLGYACIDFGGELAYETLQGSWHTGKPYGVIHRLAFKDEARGLGLASKFFVLAEKLCLEHGILNLRTDTDEDNQVMRHLLAKHGYAYCGTIDFDNSVKIAFDKRLS